MQIYLMIFCAVLVLGLMTGCGGGIIISTVPIGAGLAIIGLAMVIAAWIRSLFGGDDEA